MTPLPLFGEERFLPAVVAGLNLEGVHHYPQPELGISVRYGAGPVKADAYLYDLGLPDVPSDLRAPQVMEWFQEACGGVFTAAERGMYSDVKVLASQFLVLDADPASPFCLWAAFSLAQNPGPGTSHTGPRISHLVLRTDRGYINKIRYTYPEPAPEGVFASFVDFITGWTRAMREAPGHTAGSGS
jgi:hypothetical protein